MPAPCSWPSPAHGPFPAERHGPPGLLHTLGRARLALALAASALPATAGCATKPSVQEQALVEATIEGKNVIPASRAERDLADRQDVLAQATFWGKEYEKNPNEYEAALKLARSLRALGSTQKAMEVATQALVLKPADVDLTLVYAQAALSAGKGEAAATALARIEGVVADDWRAQSIIGVVMDQVGRHGDARAYYARALELSPGNPKVLSNLGLSLALDNRPVEAEAALRQAAGQPGADLRVKQNLSLVLGVQGKFEEAAALDRAETTTGMADDNQTYYRAMLTPGRTWEKLRGTSAN